MQLELTTLGVGNRGSREGRGTRWLVRSLHARRAPFGHEIVWTLWQLRASIDADDARWVMAIATEANELFEQAGGGTDAARADYLDILACAHYMSGDRERAIEVGERSLKLAPARSDIRQRVSVFKLER